MRRRNSSAAVAAIALAAFAYLILAADARPSVYRVRVGYSLGSGTAIATANGQTLVLTANHVVSDGGACTVGDKPARIIATDKTWDLAAIIVDEILPTSQLSKKSPVIGDNMTCAGYGPGDYKENSGIVVKFGSPVSQPEQDWVIMNAPARPGDSGGPIFYADGSLGAVLWGSDSSGVHGTHCLRVRQFLSTIKDYDALIKAVDNKYVLW
jgi:S1-C subfamily serine protease